MCKCSAGFVYLWQIEMRNIIMNKSKLVEQMAKITGLPKTSCKDCLEAFISIVSSALKQNKTVVLTGFGTFLVMERKERIGVNPATGKKMNIAARKVPKFKPGKALRSLIA